MQTCLPELILVGFEGPNMFILGDRKVQDFVIVDVPYMVLNVCQRTNESPSGGEALPPRELTWQRRQSESKSMMLLNKWFFRNSVLYKISFFLSLILTELTTRRVCSGRLVHSAAVAPVLSSGMDRRGLCTRDCRVIVSDFCNQKVTYRLKEL